MTDNARRIVYFTRFAPVAGAGGGWRRVAQILEACPSADWQLVSSVEMPLPSSHFGFLQRSPAHLRAWSRDYSQYPRNLWRKAAHWAGNFQFPPECRGALVDDPLYFEPLLGRLRNEGMKIVGICHNLESLSGEQLAEDRQRELLSHELQVLGKCDLVVTISREETFLLENLGIRTFFFPSFPPKDIHQRLMEIRAGRSGKPGKDVLMIGTAKNKATRHGMMQAMRYWQEQDLAAASGCDLLLAGYATESLAEHAGKGVRFLGPLSDEKLDRLLATVKACLCYQERASGALTRIPEMLIAGVPVLANSLAARSYYNLAGVVEFSGFAHLQEALNAVERQAGEVPVPSAPETGGLETAIRALVG